MAENAKADIEFELRSVLQSTKDGVPLRSLQGDFRSLTGNNIPFQRFGYSSLEAMLRDMPQVIRIGRRFDGELMVHAVANEATQHLSDLISRQKPSKPKRISKPRRPVRNQNWKPLTPHRSHVNSRPPLLRPPSRPPSRNSQYGPPRYTPPHFYTNSRPSLQPISTNVPLYAQDHQDFSSSRPPSKASSIPKGGPAPPPRVPVKAGPPAKSNFEVPPRFQKQPSKPDRLPLILPSVDSKHVPDPTISPSISSPTFSADAPIFIPRPPGSGPIVIPPAHPGWSSSPPPMEPGLPCPNPRSNKDLVDNYCFINGLKCVYRPFENKPKKGKKTKWLSRLILDDQKFNSYPEEMNTAAEANEEAAKRAVDKLKLHPEMISLPIVSTNTSEDKERVIGQIREIICENPQGAVHYHVQEQFKKMYKRRLPSNWMEMIEKEEHLRIDRADDTHFILFYEKSSRSTPELSQVQMNGSSELAKSPSEESSGSEDLQSYFPEALALPESKQWDIYITHADNTANICFRLIDSADAFEEFAQEMEEYYNSQTNYKYVKYPVCGVPYCVFVENSWHRVIIQNIDDYGSKVLCDFPDVGDSMWIESNLICELEKKFLEFPFQAFRCELAGLGRFSDDSFVSEKLIQRVIGKALVAEPGDRDEDNITLVLYDTSTEEDVNINKVLLDEVVVDIVPPSLVQAGSLMEGHLGDILSSGDFYLHISDRSMQLLTKLMETDAFQAQKHESPVTQVVFTEMYSVLYMDKWHRAIPASEEICDNKVLMFLIDVGIQRHIPLSNICRLDGETKLLCQVSAMAVRCQLNGISEDISLQKAAQIKEKLNKLVPEGTTLLIKVAKGSAGNQLPIVDLFKRLESNNNELVSINQTLALGFSFESDLKEKVISPVERKLSRPNSIPAPSPPPVSPAVFSEEPSSAPLVSSTFSFLENNSSLFSDRISGYPLDMVSLIPGKQEVCLTPLSTYGNTSPSVIHPGSPVVTSPASLPGSAGLMLNSNKVFNFTSMQGALSSKGMEISKQEEIPAIGEYFDVLITFAATPNNFICQSRNSSSATSELFEEMQKFYNCEDNVCEMHHCLVKAGEFFALKHKDDCWYRVCVQEIIQQDPFTMLVFLVDYGGFEMVKLSDVQVLYTKFRELPYQAISASLSGVVPVSGDYSTSNCLEFKKMVEEKRFVSVICAKEARKQHSLEGAHLSLLLVDTSTAVDVYIHDELVKMNIAKKV